MKRYQVAMLPPFDTPRPGIQDMDPPRPTHHRPDYTLREAEVVANWLNGDDAPLTTMVNRENDPWDPGRPRHLRGTLDPYPWIVGRTRPE